MSKAGPYLITRKYWAELDYLTWVQWWGVNEGETGSSSSPKAWTFDSEESASAFLEKLHKLGGADGRWLLEPLTIEHIHSKE